MPMYFMAVGWTTHSGCTYMFAGTLGAWVYFIAVGQIACSGPTYMSDGTLGVHIYFITVGRITCSGPTYMLAGTLGVCIIISGPKRYMRLKILSQPRLAGMLYAGI